MGLKGIPSSGGRDLAKGEKNNDLFIRPAVDIFETDQGLTLVADLPGVAKDDLHIDIEHDLLTVQAKAESHFRGELLQREFLHGNFFRQFQLPDEVDSDKISAEVKNGVLTLQLPKAESAKPRRIAITTA